MKFVDGNGKPLKVRLSDMMITFAYRGRSLILTFEMGQPRQPVRPVWPNGKVDMTSNTGFLCDTQNEAMVAQVATLRILELATGHNLQIVHQFDGVIATYRFVKPTAQKES